MSVVSRWGAEVEFLRPATIEDIQKLDRRDPDDHDRERLEWGQYVVGRCPEFDEDDKERLFDLALCRADGGIKEINEAARAVGCEPR